MADVDTSNVRDADLLAELEAARRNGGIGFEFLARMIVTKQERRDAEAKTAAEKSIALAAMPREKRRRVVVREALEASPPDRADIRHMHSVLAVLGLPYERLPLDVREFTRAQGNMSLNVRAGKIMTPNGEWKTQPLPFGPKARLIVMHLCSEAIRTKSPTIELADTFTAFVQEMGFSKSGGERGPLTAFREQLNALAACDMQIGTWNGVSARTSSFKPINDFDVWLSDNPAQRSLWPSTVTFSQDMFDSLKRHAVPYNIRAVRAFAGSARKLDLYFWLGWRVYNMERPKKIGWDAVKDQFGAGFTRDRAFRAQFAEEVGHLREVFPKLPLRITEGGIILEPAGPEALALPAHRPTKKG